MRESEKKVLVNLGCGHRHHAQWRNYDLIPDNPSIIYCDLSRGIPLPDNSCDVVYHSNMFEHLRRPHAVIFMSECHRVLKPNGILRVVLPDLERICRVYLEKLEKAAAGDEKGAQDYEWILLELLDQMVRETSGGQMREYFQQNPISNKDFICERIGEEGRSLIELFQRARSDVNSDRTKASSKASGPFIERVRQLLRRLSRKIRHHWKHLWLACVLTAEERKQLEVGALRFSGELHQWLYDRYSLSKLMKQAGFKQTIVQSPLQSLIPDWPAYHLDTLDDGTVIKPDSFIMEGVRS